MGGAIGLWLAGRSEASECRGVFEVGSRDEEGCRWGVVVEHWGAGVEGGWGL